MKYVSCFSFTAFIYILFVPLAARGKNIVVILSDDHRYDFMSFMEESPEFLETPNLDRLATEGAHLANAFVTTISLFSQPGLHSHRTIYAKSSGG